MIIPCLGADGWSVDVLDFSGSRRLAWSRFCRRHEQSSRALLDADDDHMAALIDDRCRRWDIDVVLPAGMTATLLLARIGSQLRQAAVFPTSSTEAIEVLRDKWRFRGLLSDLGLPHPNTELIETAAQLEAWAGDLPVILKPTDRGGGQGIRVVTGTTDLLAARHAAAAGDALPLVLQTFVEGTDVVAAMLCREGRILRYIVQEYAADGSHAAFYRSEEILNLIRPIVETLRLEGVVQFDLRRGVDGLLWLIECNPRFWASALRAACNGVNVPADGARLAVGEPLTKQRSNESRVRHIWPGVLIRQIGQRKIRLRDVSRGTWRDLWLRASDPGLALAVAVDSDVAHADLEA